jgi:hypothetical protein
MRWSRPILLACLAAGAGGGAGCGGAAASSADEGTRADEYAASDFPEDTLLPVAGDWLDPPRALAGVGQFDRLKTTIHDDAKCSTMVAVAAAIVGGRARFLEFLDAVAALRAGHGDDLAIVDRARAAALASKLTPRHLHELTEAVVRAYKVAYGAYDKQIIAMVKASGYEAVHVGSRKPLVLVEALGPREVVPLGTIADNEGHVILLWKDARGTARLYDSDDIHGSHVLLHGSALYRARMENPATSWDPGDKYR